MRQKLLEFIRHNPRCSFSEIELMYAKEGYAFKGDYAIALEKYENLSFWYGWSRDAAGLIWSLYESGDIALLPAHQIEILSFGRVFKYPIANQCRSYKKEHWLPIVISPSEKEAQN